MKFINKFVIFSAAISYSVAGICLGYVAESANYRLERDSLNAGGGDFSESSSYLLSDTVGDISGGFAGVLTAVTAGYRASEDEYYLTISAPVDVSMSPGLDGTVGGSSTGEAAWTVVTNDPDGYILYLASAASPALASVSDSFADYEPVESDVPDYSFTIAASESAFGFSVEGDDIAQNFKDNGSVCNSGSADTADSCWLGFDLADQEIASSSGANDPAGAITTVKFKATIGADKLQLQGDYTAALTVTALAQ